MERRTGRQFICKNCGQKYRAKESTRDQFCGRDCYFAYVHARSTAKPVDDWEHWYYRRCGECGTVRVSKNKNAANLCGSSDCAKLSARKLAQQHYRKARATVPLVRVTCLECGQGFDKLQTNTSRIYCGDRCSMRVNRRERKARIKSGVVGRKVYFDEIYRRDRGMCHICRTRVDRYRFKAPHPLAPAAADPKAAWAITRMAKPGRVKSLAT